MTTRDVYIFDTPDGGDLTQDLEIRDGLENSVYLSLFGGNVLDDGSQDTPFQWWGNLNENEESKKYRSQASYLLRTVPPTPNNLRRIEDAAKRDLAWMISDDVTETVSVTATMPALNTVKLTIVLNGIDPIEFRAFWDNKTEEQLSNLVQPPTVLINDGVTLSGRGMPGAELVLALSNGSVITVPISANGAWSIEPYPLYMGEIATAFVRTRSGLSSRGVKVIGVGALLYNGAVLYDGSQTYDGIMDA